MKTTKMTDKLEVTVKRPNGEIEVVIHPTLTRLTDTMFEQCKKATKDAGKGDLLSYKTIEIEEPMTLKEQRYDLCLDISGQIYMQDMARDRDYDNDIGFHESPKYDAKIAELRGELKAFDDTYPEVVAEINRLKAIETEQQIQSVLNA